MERQEQTPETASPVEPVVSCRDLSLRIDMKKHLMETARIHRDMGDPLTIEDLADIALDIQTKNIEAHEKNQELFFVGYTNGAQVLYASEDEGSFYSNTENECFIPLYMLNTHEHRLEGKLTSGLNFETVLKVRGTKDS